MNKVNIVEEKSLIEQLREVRDKIGIEIQDLSFEQLRTYLNEKENFDSNTRFKKLADSL